VTDPIFREINLQTNEASQIEWINSKKETIKIILPRTVYPPKEDTQLIEKCVSEIGLGNGRKLLEIGCGSGAVSISAALSGWEVTACDINPLAVVATKGNCKLNGVNINLFEGGIVDENDNYLENFCESNPQFDLIIWNLPYLSPPTTEDEPRLGPLEDAALIDLDGERGWGEVLLDKLEQHPGLLSEGGAIYLLHSNNTRGNLLQSKWRLNGWATRIIGESNLGDGELITCFSAWKPFNNKSIEWHEELDSTNKYMLDNKLEIGKCVVAKKQTSGRGQRNRKWVTRAGDFAGSWMIDSELCSNIIGNFQLSAALSVVDSICAILNRPLPSIHWSKCRKINDLGINIRWPNDIWDSNGKLAGCLIEGRQVGENQSIVLGIGANINPGDEREFEMSGIREICGNDLSLEEFASILNCSVSSLFEIHPLSPFPDANKHQNSIWMLMSNYLSEGKLLFQEERNFSVKGINNESELICHNDEETLIVSNSFNCKWE